MKFGVYSSVEKEEKVRRMLPWFKKKYGSKSRRIIELMEIEYDYHQKKNAQKMIDQVLNYNETEKEPKDDQN
jgi:hypothetical protein